MAPTLFARYSYQQSINDRVNNLWRVHLNREKKGLGGTKNSSNTYSDNDHTQDRAFQINNGLHLSLNSLVEGETMDPSLNNPFTRFNQTIVDYPSELGNMDDVSLY